MFECKFINWSFCFKGKWLDEKNGVVRELPASTKDGTNLVPMKIYEVKVVTADRRSAGIVICFIFKKKTKIIYSCQQTTKVQMQLFRLHCMVLMAVIRVNVCSTATLIAEKRLCFNWSALISAI